ncbi:phosphoesterase family-domain-containing protein [Achaetomium macrosporum]|uniref:Phosphoesterase family-domain-containing protein n=1 Tax=Achaetomium macrosporum TaxID=79813 RepID=A0AAN7CHK2_9PEZI|nr:phosphoesterase family-domain-containing protein [Achaetomium macrosporum]
MQRLFATLLGWVCLCIVSAAGLVPGKAFERFITIWLENQDYAKVAADPSIADLKRQGILLTRYYAHTHPSQPNYIAAVGGDYFGLNHDDFVRIPENVATVADLLEFKDVTWAGYFEDVPGPGYMGNFSDGSTGNGAWDYVRKHNPFVSYDSITANGERLLNLGSFDDFRRAFAAKKVPQFVFMSPNMMNDGHNTTLDFATKWSHEFLQPLLAEKAFKERTLIALTYDESETYSEPNHIVTLLLGSAIPRSLRGTQDNTFYTHYSILSTVEANWGLHNLGRYDVGANVFQFVADLAGYTQNKDPENALAVNNSVSYPGMLNDDPSRRLPIPAPNTKLIGAGGLPVLPSIEAAWSGVRKVQTPYDGSGRVCDGDRNPPIYNAPAANPP